MTLEELTRLLEQQSQYGFTGQSVPISYDQIIQAIQGQYTPVQMPSFDVPSINIPKFQSGANRFITQPISSQDQIIEYGRALQQSPPSFTPGVFDIEKYRYKAPATVSDVVNVIADNQGGFGPGDNSVGGSGISTDDAGLATSSNVSPNAISAAAVGLSLATGLPVNLAVSAIGKNTIAKAINEQSYNAALAHNIAMVAAQMGLNPSDPANSAAISAGIQSLSQAPTGTTAATAGTSGTGGAASAAAQAAAFAGVAMGLSDDAIAALSQTAANNAISGMTAEQAVNSAISGTVGTTTGPDNVDVGGGWSPAGDTSSGGSDAEGMD